MPPRPKVETHSVLVWHSWWFPTLNVTSSECEITLQTNMFLNSDEIASVIYLQIWCDTADEQVYHYSNWRMHFVLDTNIFGAGHTRVLCWWRQHFSAGDKQAENVCSNFTHTRTQSATRDFQTELISTHLQKYARSPRGDPKVTYCTCRCTTASFKAKFIL